MYSLFLISILIIALVIPVSVYASLEIPIDTAKRYPVLGSHTGIINSTIGEVIDMQGMSTLTWVFEVTGSVNNFTNINLTVQANQEGGGHDWLTAGTLNLGNEVNKVLTGGTFSNANYTGFKFNPAGFPFVRIMTEEGVNGTIPNLFWTATP